MSDEFDAYALANADEPLGVAPAPVEGIPDWPASAYDDGEDAIPLMPGAVRDEAIEAAWRDWWLPRKGGA